MWQPNPFLLVAALPLCVLALSSPCTVAAGGGGGKPLVTAITKDAATSFYTAPLKDGNPVVLDLSGPLIWSTCAASHPTIECHSDACMRAHRYQHAGAATGYGRADAGDPYMCKCTAHPHNPCTGENGSGDLTRVTLAANATDGKNPLYPVSFAAVASCAAESLLAKLPAGAVGVAGLARSSLAFPAQVANAERVARRFALCLPSGGAGAGVAIFGGGAFFLLPPGRADIMETTMAVDTPLHKHDESPGYYIAADKGIAVNQVQVGGYGAAPLAVALCSTTPYTALRSDVYGPFVRAFEQATAGRARVTPPVPPFELCYDSSKLSPTRLGYAVPQIDLMLEGGKNWTVFGGNSMVQVNDDTACLAFVEMKKADDNSGAPAAVTIGGFQMENNLVVFDEEKQRLGFSGLLWGRQTTCSNFNFTMAAAA